MFPAVSVSESDKESVSVEPLPPVPALGSVISAPTLTDCVSRRRRPPEVETVGKCVCSYVRMFLCACLHVCACARVAWVRRGDTTHAWVCARRRMYACRRVAGGVIGAFHLMCAQRCSKARTYPPRKTHAGPPHVRSDVCASVRATWPYARHLCLRGCTLVSVGRTV